MAHTEYEKALSEKIVDMDESLILIWDPAGNIKFCNRKAQEITGSRDEEVLGKKWMDVCVPREYGPDFQVHLNPLAQESFAPRRAEYPVLSKDGREILIAWDRVLIRDEGGKTETTLSIGHDLTTARVLEGERYRIETILDSIADGVFPVDRDSRITSFKRAATHITGVQALTMG